MCVPALLFIASRPPVHIVFFVLVFKKMVCLPPKKIKLPAAARLPLPHKRPRPPSPTPPSPRRCC